MTTIRPAMQTSPGVHAVGEDLKINSKQTCIVNYDNSIHNKVLSGGNNDVDKLYKKIKKLMDYKNNLFDMRDNPQNYPPKCITDINNDISRYQNGEMRKWNEKIVKINRDCRQLAEEIMAVNKLTS